MVLKTLLANLEKFLSKMPSKWNGRRAIFEMKNSGYSHWKQMEWIGFYFQFLCENKLSEFVKIPGPKYGKVEFDGLAEIPWDFKAHPDKNAKGQKNENVIANDRIATMKAVKEFGAAGLILAVGDAEYNDEKRSFQIWHKRLKGGLSKYEEQRILRNAPSRLRKTSFRLKEIDLFLLDFKTIKNFASFQEGFRNSDGSPRKKKILLNLAAIKPDKVIKF